MKIWVFSLIQRPFYYVKCDFILRFYFVFVNNIQSEKGLATNCNYLILLPCLKFYVCSSFVWKTISQGKLQYNEAYESSSSKDVELVKLVEKNSSIFQSLQIRNLLMKKNLSNSLINIRRPSITGKSTYSISV